MTEAGTPVTHTGPRRDQLGPILTRAEHRRLMYLALGLWILISAFVVFQPYLLEIPPVRTVVTLLLALPIAIFWFIFWPQQLVAKISPSPYIQVPLLLSGPIVIFLLFWGLIELPLRSFVGPSGKVFVVRTAGDGDYTIPHYGDAQLVRTTGNNSVVDAYFIPYSERLRNGHLKAIYVLFAPGEREFTAKYQPTTQHRAVEVHFNRSKDFMEIPKAVLKDPDT